MTRPITVLKLGGELLESHPKAMAIAPAIGELAGEGPLVVVHGGGKDIDAEVARRGLQKQTVDGLRITDADTLDAVVAAVAGTVNTRLVAALAAHGVPGVGLTGADAVVVHATRARQHRAVDGRLVDLGLVGEPTDAAPPRLIGDLLSHGYVPVLACLGCTEEGTVLNINADTLASTLARVLRAPRLIVAGATRGVLDADGSTIDALDPPTLAAMIADGRASAGMVAKLRACRAAFAAGVAVTIVDGRDVLSFHAAPGTRLVDPAATPAV